MPFALQSSVSCDGHAVTFACALQAQDPLRRDILLRKAWESALRQRPDSARPYLAAVRDRKWVAAAGFPRLLDFAATLPDADAEPLLVAAARHDPGVALRDVRTITALPYGSQVLEAAILASPGEAVGVAAGSSPTGQLVLEALRSHPRLQRLLRLALDTATDLPTRQRAALLGDDTYRDARDNRRYFSRLTARQPVPTQAIEFAQSTLRELRNSGIRSLAAWDPSELYKLIVYGREELDESLLKALAPRLPPAKLKFPLPRLRAFWADAIAFGQPQLLPPNALTQAFQGIAQSTNPLEETLFAASILDSLQSPAGLQTAAASIAREYSSAGMYQPLYGLLAAHLSPRLPSPHILEPIAANYRRFLNAPQSLAVDPLFSFNGLSIHRYFFYDDDDGVESYNTFLAAYRNSPGWSVHIHPDWVQINGVHASRRIEIYSNIPFHPTADAAIHAALNGREPQVLVHRGHAFHTGKTLRRLTPATRLVFLGSCRGMENVAEVLDNASQAQMFATRGTGSYTVNDPLLKALNDRLLRAGPDLDWNQFWTAEQAQFRGNPLFADYIPPHRNTQAILLRAYYAYLSGE